MGEIECHSGTCETDDENRRRLVDRNVSGYPASDATRRNGYGMNPRRDTRGNRELARRDASRILHEARSELSKLASSSESRRSPRDSASPRNKCRTKLHKPACRAPARRIRARATCMLVIPRRGNDVRPTQTEILIRRRDALHPDAEHATSLHCLVGGGEGGTCGNGRDFLRMLLG
jgi:hypothetical protein